MAALLDKIIKKNKKEEPKTQKKSVASDNSKKQPVISKDKLAWIYTILQEPHITEKATDLAENNKYVFKVRPKANKIEVKKAIESLYEVKVDKVNMTTIRPKKRRLGRYEGWKGGLKKGSKKAVVTLVKGQTIDLIPK